MIESSPEDEPDGLGNVGARREISPKPVRQDIHQGRVPCLARNVRKKEPVAAGMFLLEKTPRLDGQELRHTSKTKQMCKPQKTLSRNIGEYVSFSHGRAWAGAVDG